MIVNLEDIKLSLKVNNITMNDEELNDLVQYYINKVVSLTGVNLDVQTYHYTLTNKRGLDKIVLPLSDIFDVDVIHINYELYDDSNYFVDTHNGVIFFKNPLGFCEHIHIKYLTKPDDALVSGILTPLIGDMIIDDNSDGDNGMGIGGEISSIHEGGVSISFKSSTSLHDSINDRLNKLASGELLLGTGKVKKGAFYI